MDDSIYHWNVQLEAHGFVGLGEGGKQLASDLSQVGRGGGGGGGGGGERGWREERGQEVGCSPADA